MKKCTPLNYYGSTVPVAVCILYPTLKARTPDFYQLIKNVCGNFSVRRISEDEYTFCEELRLQAELVHN